MDILAACEELAANIAAFDLADADANTDRSHISDSDRLMWQTLFNLSSDEAAKAIRDWRADFTRLAISQAAWLLVKEAKTAEGFNKESYEYSLTKAQKGRQESATATDKGVSYLLTLESLESAELLCCLPKKPNILTGLDDDGQATKFCLLSSYDKADILNALLKAHLSHQPTFIRISVAAKNLSPTSLYPTLGVDNTLPQFRLDSFSSSSPPPLVRPAQDEYPVWYFFYGTLADASILSRIIGREEVTIKYKSARIRRGQLSIWGGKYRALVDADEHSTVDGWAYEVKNQTEEDSLRVYETGNYDVVRCIIKFTDSGVSIHGLTFRLI